VTDQPAAVLSLVDRAYRALAAASDRPKILVASNFDRLGEALPVLAATPVEGLALDFTGPATANLGALAAIGGLPGKRLVAGVVLVGDQHRLRGGQPPDQLVVGGEPVGVLGGQLGLPTPPIPTSSRRSAKGVALLE
jgi:hypothetical protein